VHETRAHSEAARERRRERREAREAAAAARAAARRAEIAERDRRRAALRLGAGPEPFEIDPAARRSWDPPDPRLPYARKGEPFLGCGDGECAWYTTSIAALTCHTVEQHGREPSRAERTPITDVDEQERRVAAYAYLSRPAVSL
jgi:hypothetical protein